MKLLSHVGAILNHRFVAYRTTHHLREISHAALVDNSSRVLTDFLRTGEKNINSIFLEWSVSLEQPWLFLKFS